MYPDDHEISGQIFGHNLSENQVLEKTVSQPVFLDQTGGFTLAYGMRWRLKDLHADQRCHCEYIYRDRQASTLKISEPYPKTTYGLEVITVVIMGVEVRKRRSSEHPGSA